MLNRAARRTLHRQVSKGRPATGFRGVVLVGGPLDGLIVAPTAPALHRDWWRSWNKAIEVGYATGAPVQPGRYVRDPNADLATAMWLLDEADQ